MILFVWLLLTLPGDKYLCDIWTRELTRTAIVQACGVDVADLEGYRVDVFENGVKICEVDGEQILFTAEWCNLHKKYDAYRLRVVLPNWQELTGCTVTTSAKEQPSESVIRSQCPKTPLLYEIRYGGETTVEEPPSACMPPIIDQPASIATQKDLHLLAGKLIWYGYARAACLNGFSGVDPETFAATPCGMDGARPEMIAWQNSLDDAILAAAREWNVPADLLKRLIERETQFWAWTGTDDEHGLIQITDDGASVLMHVYQVGYYRLDAIEQAHVRAAWLRSLDCDYCTPKQVIEKARADMGKYAQALAAYYCTNGNWNAALTAWNINHKENQ